jgi:hypothetical protein
VGLGAGSAALALSGLVPASRSGVYPATRWRSADRPAKPTAVLQLASASNTAYVTCPGPTGLARPPPVVRISKAASGAVSRRSSLAAASSGLRGLPRGALDRHRHLRIS